MERSKQIGDQCLTQNLNYLFKAVTTTVSSKKFRNENLQQLAEFYDKKTVEYNEYIDICQCYFLLNQSLKVADILKSLINQNSEVPLIQ